MLRRIEQNKVAVSTGTHSLLSSSISSFFWQPDEGSAMLSCEHGMQQAVKWPCGRAWGGVVAASPLRGNQCKQFKERYTTAKAAGMVGAADSPSCWATPAAACHSPLLLLRAAKEAVPQQESVKSRRRDAIKQVSTTCFEPPVAGGSGFGIFYFWLQSQVLHQQFVKHADPHHHCLQACGTASAGASASVLATSVRSRVLGSQGR